MQRPDVSRRNAAGPRHVPDDVFLPVLSTPIALPRALPARPNGEAWPELTQAWYAGMRQTLQLMGARVAMTASDISVLVTTALIHAELCEHPSSALATELRRREALFGATLADRLRLIGGTMADVLADLDDDDE